VKKKTGRQRRPRRRAPGRHTLPDVLREIGSALFCAAKDLEKTGDRIRSQAAKAGIKI
jgi:hypothetical protein